jgi:hypothetical protein
VAQAFGDALEVPRQAGQGTAGGRRRHVHLQDVGRRTELVYRVAGGGRELLVVRPIRAIPVQSLRVEDFRRREGAEWHRGGKGVADAVFPAVAVAPAEGVEITDALPRPHLQAVDDGEGERLVARHGQQQTLKRHGLLRAFEIQLVAGREQLEEHVAIGDAVVQQLGHPEAKGNAAITVDVRAEAAGDRRLGDEARGLGGVLLRAPVDEGGAARRIEAGATGEGCSRLLRRHASSAQTKNSVDRGGTVTGAENGCPWCGAGCADRPPRLPRLPPP